MMETKELTDLLKSLPSDSNADGKGVVLTDSNGNPSQIDPSALMPISTNVFSNGGYALRDQGLYLCFAYSQSNHFLNCFYIAASLPYDNVNNVMPCVILKENGMTISVLNAFGTINYKSTTSNSLPGDIKTKAVRLIV